MYLPIGSFLICSLVKHFGEINGILFESSLIEFFDAPSAISRGTICDFSIGFGSGFTNDDKLQVVKLSDTGSFLEPSSLDESTELVASDPLSLELSFSLSLLFEELQEKINFVSFVLFYEYTLYL